MVEELGGAKASICEPGYGAVMAAIGESAFGPRTRFSLATVPDVATLEVTIDTAPCPAGESTWSWSAAWNAVVFEPEGSCLPQPGQTVTVDYDALCFVP